MEEHIKICAFGRTFSLDVCLDALPLQIEILKSTTTFVTTLIDNTDVPGCSLESEEIRILESFASQLAILDSMEQSALKTCQSTSKSMRSNHMSYEKAQHKRSAECLSPVLGQNALVTQSYRLLSSGDGCSTEPQKEAARLEVAPPPTETQAQSSTHVSQDCTKRVPFHSSFMPSLRTFSHFFQKKVKVTPIPSSSADTQHKQGNLTGDSYNNSFSNVGPGHL